MKTNLHTLFCTFACLFLMVSCTTDSVEDYDQPELITAYDYTSLESSLVVAINDYRVSQGKNSLELINHVSYKSQEHNLYMIENNVVNHDLFDERANNIIQVVGAVKVGENVAYNFQSAADVLSAWLASPGHKKTLDGDYTHIGVSISINPDNGKSYYTNMFVKK